VELGPLQELSDYRILRACGDMPASHRDPSHELVEPNRGPISGSGARGAGHTTALHCFRERGARCIRTISSTPPGISAATDVHLSWYFDLTVKLEKRSRSERLAAEIAYTQGRSVSDYRDLEIPPRKLLGFVAGDQTLSSLSLRRNSGVHWR
jgi:hypothetical protein